MKLLANYIFFCLLLFSFKAFSQEKKLHELLALPNDTVKVRKLTAFAKANGYTDRPKAKEAMQAILKISQQIQFNEGLAIGYAYLGYYDGEAGKYRNSITLFNQAIVYYKRANDLFGLTKCLGNLANAYDALGKSDSGVVCRMAAIEILEKTKNPSKEWQFSLALQYFNMAVGYEKFLTNTGKAFQYYKRAEAISRENRDTGMLISALRGLIEIWIQNAQLSEALKASQEGMDLCKHFEDNYILSIAYVSYGQSLAALNRIDASIEVFKKAVLYAERSGSMEDVVNRLIHLASSYNKKKDYKAQIDILEKALNKLDAEGGIKFRSEIYEGLANANQMLCNYQKAYQYLNLQMQYKDSAVKAENNKIIADKETRYQVSQKEKALSQQQLKIAQKEVQLQKSREINFYSMGSALVGLLIAILVFFHYRNKRKLHHQHLQTLHKEKELQLLQAAMEGEEKERSRIAKDLHDGVAGMLSAAKMQLSSLSMRNSGLTETKEFSQAVRLLDDSCHEVRMTSHNLMPEVLIQHGLDEAIHRFCNNIANDSVLQIQYAAYGTIGRYKLNFELTVYRIVQELLNNIVKHAKATAAAVQLSVQDNYLSITIEDNGAGFDKSKAAKNGTGLHSILRRVEAMNGTLEIDAQEEQGVTAFIGIDITNYKL